MKKVLACFLTTAVWMGALSWGSFPSIAQENASEKEISYDQVASEAETTEAQEVGVEGMSPVYGDDIKDGVYEVEVEVSSSMFPVDKAELTVSQGKMIAVLTMGGKGYLKLFMGTAKEAAASGLSSYIDFQENEEGKHTFTVPVEALDMPISCAAFSKNKEKWYDRSILFQAESLPKDAVLVELPDYEALKKEAREKRIEAIRAEKNGENSSEENGSASGGEAVSQEEALEQPLAEPAFIELEDGEYAITAELKGGTGRTTVTSPAPLFVEDGQAYAQIEWSSTSYDYMIVGGQKYLPVNTEGRSTFRIPILVYDEPMEVIADTTAMSTPHEITYTLTFPMDSVISKDQTPQAAAQRMVYMVILIVAVCGVVSYINKRKRNSVR